MRNSVDFVKVMREQIEVGDKLRSQYKELEHELSRTVRELEKTRMEFAKREAEVI